MAESDRVCAPDVDRGRAYCGRKTKNTDAWQRVNCRDCHAAYRADHEGNKR